MAVTSWEREEMADEQPGHVARDVRDVSKVPLAKELVKNNVGSTVKHQEQNSKFVVVSQVTSNDALSEYPQMLLS